MLARSTPILEREWRSTPFPRCDRLAALIREAYAVCFLGGRAMIEASIKRKLVFTIVSIAVGWPGIAGSQMIAPRVPDFPRPIPLDPGPGPGIAPGPNLTPGPGIAPGPAVEPIPNSPGPDQGRTESKAAEELTPEDRARVLSQVLDTLPIVGKAKMGTQ
jgi:hypothetical protein